MQKITDYAIKYLPFIYFAGFLVSLLKPNWFSIMGNMAILAFSAVFIPSSIGLIAVLYIRRVGDSITYTHTNLKEEVKNNLISLNNREKELLFKGPPNQLHKELYELNWERSEYIDKIASLKKVNPKKDLFIQILLSIVILFIIPLRGIYQTNQPTWLVWVINFSGSLLFFLIIYLFIKALFWVVILSLIKEQ